jgi:hypothetical protein
MLQFSTFFPIIMVILTLQIQMDWKVIWEGTEAVFWPAKGQHNDKILLVHNTPNNGSLANSLGRKSDHYHGPLLKQSETTLLIST